MKPLIFKQKVVDNNGNFYNLNSVKEHLDEINSSLESVVITLTATSSESITVGQQFYVYLDVSGNIVTLNTNLRVTASKSMVVSEALLTIPEKYRPKHSVFFGGTTQDNVGFYGYVPPSGNFEVGLLSTATTFLRLSTSWVI